MLLHRRSVVFGATSVACAAVVLGGSRVAAETPQIYSESGVAVDGSDVVAYFKQGRPVTGSDAYTVMWSGVEWRFASAENRDLFAANPAAYAPQYGGYCAWAVSQGYTASTVPDAWKIVDGKLYLNYSKRIQRRWERDIPSQIASADSNWPAVLR